MEEPLLSCYTIIGRDVKLLKSWIHDVESRVGLPEDQVEVDIVAWKPSAEILEFLTNSKYRFVIYDPIKEHGNEEYYRDLYECWNRGVAMSRAKYVLRSGSDQRFSKNFGKNTIELMQKFEQEHGKDLITNLYTIEAFEGQINKFGTNTSRHVTACWGTTADDFDQERFDKFCEAIGEDRLFSNAEYNLHLRHAVRGWVPSTSGASWVLKRKIYEQLGPMPTFIMQNGLTGDVFIFDQLASMGIDEYMVGNAFAYHFVKGESS